MKNICVLFFCLIGSISYSQENISSAIMARTIGPLPFLEYGLGDDRLGGAKMTYLDSNVVLKIVDSANTDYKVQLSKYHTAYIDKASVELLPDSIKQPRPYYLTNNWKVFGDSAFDYVTVLLDERLPYRAQQMINPSKIAVDIFGATSNTNWIIQLGTAQEVKNAWYEQTEDDVMRVYIELKHQQHWGYFINYDTSGAKLNIRIKRQPAFVDVRKLKIAIDAGHGGDNKGTTGVTSNVLEKDYTLLYAKELDRELKEKGVENVFMTRTKDTTLSMVERVDMLRQYNPDILISIHFNSSGLDSVNGTSTYYRYIGFRPLTQFILGRMKETGLNEYANVGSFNFALSGPTDYPNCLVEVAFLSNKEDEKKILDPKFRQLVAQQIYLGIVDWLIEVQIKDLNQ